MKCEIFNNSLTDISALAIGPSDSVYLISQNNLWQYFYGDQTPILLATAGQLAHAAQLNPQDLNILDITKMDTGSDDPNIAISLADSGNILVFSKTNGAALALSEDVIKNLTGLNQADVFALERAGGRGAAVGGRAAQVGPVRRQGQRGHEQEQDRRQANETQHASPPGGSFPPEDCSPDYGPS